MSGTVCLLSLSGPAACSGLILYLFINGAGFALMALDKHLARGRQARDGVERPGVNREVFRRRQHLHKPAVGLHPRGKPLGLGALIVVLATAHAVLRS